MLKTISCLTDLGDPINLASSECASGHQEFIRLASHAVIGVDKEQSSMHFWLDAEQSGTYQCIGELVISIQSSITVSIFLNPRTEEPVLIQGMVSFARHFGQYLNARMFAATFGENPSSVFQEFLDSFGFTHYR
ncbi:MAG: hypothetical protein G01um101420_749 [Parcubacteria group bacterium Gr01-1014_20]|nr:MAG: hypothetical protein G01um101420_749 [Parcubacteria group bacterium Gr01-1014_20]